MVFKVDDQGKVTVSLGGGCRLWCKHCYITTKQFRHSRLRSVDEVITSLLEVQQTFSVICISGDTDCFIHEEAGLALIDELSLRFPSTDLMFTTRLVPKDETISRLIMIGRRILAKRYLFVPCVSFVSWTYPNQVENPGYVPSSLERVELLRRFCEAGLPCFMAMRPTFPFSIVPPGEVESLIAAGGRVAAAVLGEAFLLDPRGEIADRLGVQSFDAADARGPLTFLPQESTWKKRLYEEEVRFAQDACKQRAVPYFMRSMSGIRYLRRYWDHSAGSSDWKPGEYLDLTCETSLP